MLDLASAREEAAVSATQLVLDALVRNLAEAIRPAVVMPAGPGAADADVVVTPVALSRVGRSRRGGALLDLELTVSLVATGAEALSHLERLLVVAEQSPQMVAGPPLEPPALGFTLVLGVSVPIEEPTGPLVTTPVVELHPLTVLAGRVVTAAGQGAGGVAVSSSRTRQSVRTDPVGHFQLVGTGEPTTLTATSGELSASVETTPGATQILIELPSPPEGS